MDWYFSQMKGTSEEMINEADIISCLEFDETGEFVATGDKGGRVVIFKRNNNTEKHMTDYTVHCTFTSHEPEFDYLKSLEIEEKINKIKWLPQINESRFLLSTNDKTIKLWRISEQQKRPIGFNFSNDIKFSSSEVLTTEEKRKLSYPNYVSTPRELRIPYYEVSKPVIEARVRRVFPNAHTYHINSISINSDQETFLSSDDLRINLWNLQMTDKSFNIVDIKPTNMEDLTEVITTAQFHPTSCSLLIYSSSKGTIRLCDMRERALCDNCSIVLDEIDDSTSRSFFSEIISSISDINFSHSGRYVLSRDYLSLKVWDINMPRSPVATYPVHDYLRLKLCALYETDCIFDKFECCWSPDDKYVMTGSYNNFFRIFDRVSNKDITLELNRDLALYNKPLQSRRISTEGGHQRRRDEISVDCIDFHRRLLHLAWHPHQNFLAIAATNNLFMVESRNHVTSNSIVNVVDKVVPFSGNYRSSTSVNACSTSGYSNSLSVQPSSEVNIDVDQITFFLSPESIDTRRNIPKPNLSQS